MSDASGGDVLGRARWYVAEGLSVIPVKADGSKAPALSGWRKYSAEVPDDATLVKWFGGKEVYGIGVPPGPASGNLVVLDFEHVGGESAYFEWLQRLPDDLRRLATALPTVATPSGGRHVWVRLPAPQPGAKLARYASGKTKIEIRGEGHQVLAPGCPLECHQTDGKATGRLYEWVAPPVLVELDPDVWAELVEWCCACNEYQAPEQPRDRDRGAAPAGADSSGSDFNARGAWAETGLFDAGWTWHRKTGDDRGFLTRPGKDGGISASLGVVCSRAAGYPYLYVWSTSTDFAPETPYSRFGVFAALKHGNDFAAAAKDLARLGYGERREMGGGRAVDMSGLAMRLGTRDGQPVYPFAGGTPGAGPTPPGADAETPTGPPVEPKPFKWMSELNAQAETAKWVWQGYLARGGITLFSALWKSGKSTLLSHLLKSLDGSRAEFLGLPVSPARVLYVTEEHESIWADRRDALLIGDHVGMACRPFKMRPTMAEWREFLRVLAEQIRKHHFDLIVFDTLSKMWPVREENDAGQVEEALMPLWTMCQEDVAVLLVHHTRKSGGEQFVASRGSGGLPAFCEILVEFGPPNDDPKETKRVLRGKGRYADTPVKWEAELVGGRYVGLGDPDDRASPAADRKRFEWEPELMKVLEGACGEWFRFADIEPALAERRGGQRANRVDVLAALNRRIDGGEVERQGEGHKGSPYEYRLPE